jgi:hypothetical protein
MILCVIIAAIAVSYGYSQDDIKSREAGVMRLIGRVMSIDWVGSKLTVNDTVFTVPNGVKVTKGASDIGFSDVNVKDPVVVYYRRDVSGELRVISITVDYGGDFPV